ncbi:hypothetical protein RRG08_061247 [Elysia crispata]|uniref:Uncharacterized protein n=1 Tax=Elysia crispata TaxID=231223 RepID=A0AAE0ZG15_9GAST|nr:hypothetical protein RRG08_061247 [Elysia crispata]
MPGCPQGLHALPSEIPVDIPSICLPRDPINGSKKRASSFQNTPSQPAHLILVVTWLRNQRHEHLDQNYF